MVPPTFPKPSVPPVASSTVPKPGTPGGGQAAPAPKPSQSGGSINSGGGAGETGVNGALLAAGGLVLLAGVGTGIVLLTRKRRSDGHDSE
ncbi:hypothetical protein [Rhodococcus sp. APC 3903]|uniref:hypothetical protein n=1 Tax=Rhodococcus sp. APC 3903 TaxID=3035193 RepID=UPI0025B356C6|nr:hypothetical protein [Rhodococcus sp. APC 3903]MDN3460953.1 hypothetical protein [Rhodococcus sp. APC 3903]